jgi:hypothetical protein
VPADPRDDWAAFAGREEMFYGLPDPFGQIRAEVQAGLRRQVADAELVKITTSEEPKLATAAREVNEGRQLEVTAFAFMFRAKLDVCSGPGGVRQDKLDAAVTMMFGRLDRPGEQTSRTYFDLNADAAKNFDDEVLKQRFVDFHETHAHAQS